MCVITPNCMGIQSSNINNLKISEISWEKFKGKVPEQPQYFAHIFWTFTYKYYFNSGEFPNKPHVVACVEVSPRSWSRNEKQNDKLLQHEYGHYLIGCLCALEFMDKVNKKDAAFFTDKKKAIKFCQNSYVSTLKQFLKIEKKYDEETQHYYCQEQQKKWEEDIAKQINSKIQGSKSSNGKNSQSLCSLKTTDSRPGSSQSRSRRSCSLNRISARSRSNIGNKQLQKVQKKPGVSNLPPKLPRVPLSRPTINCN